MARLVHSAAVCPALYMQKFWEHWEIIGPYATDQGQK